MNEILADFVPGTTLAWQVIAARLGVAVLLGAVLGFERELVERPAGLRTHMLVCLASATFAIIALEIVSLSAFRGDHIRADPIRLVEAITSGVAFLAAGFIIFKRGAVRGLTTGAGMWLAAATGLAAGLGLWVVAALACLLGTIVLTLVRWFETSLKFKHPRRRHGYAADREARAAHANEPE
ncbi:MgtC/SapB family protein [Aquibium sp. A9E412]|uniref:MgtC/SapB family protein n=1 Tax=Aquibium sp. A9E412 TaxID=2976767 RepID=UPI0025AED7B5|nr:MgtC/SapB family protein [Aquibium sp. A9E412]MDN2565716.1 MgtC/SapB family protein [Aquibium sp. A9E412]